MHCITPATPGRAVAGFDITVDMDAAVIGGYSTSWLRMVHPHQA